MSTLTFEHVTVRYGGRHRGLTAVDGVDLTVPDGATVGLVGESGSGKSTLARAAVGLTPVTGGRVLLDGRPLRRRGPVRMVFQDPYSSLDPRMTIGASLAEALPRGTRHRRDEVGGLLELVGLDPDRAAMLPAQLSGGQRQRVALARALAGRPQVVIADEITSALDVSIQGTVLNLVRDLQRRMRLSMLFISHDLAVVRYVSDLIAVMYLGRIVEYGPAGDVLRDPQHPYTRELLAAAEAVALSEPDAVADTEPADPHHPPPGCRFHPRCPIGPLVHPGRGICREAEPAGEGHRHHAACHFAATPELVS
ncbi:oligopeptide/dipeptide ABC transporter ATP-binding protein [Amycolatopsis bartoniae]|uniref:Dipeptide/oligopeptide/nickel ABC transporter ATP-binding protein n=1 Tax=Amycolatopsis bartoniae TaxID=941986 RepID=A0A8H9M5A3_9PSEU|nr:ABC transporter ATP-binding protein [Amycolatopsis bartoniae]MBB2939836.1 oligopeptide/dipeptide ABC transporter ATP-binding protein [Amycolatopsis bartoniae]TVT07460.1 ABC transporter ATP-binding protein [Amycolatopsis bartoniae]GHF54840.1 dipeptide/oligopeptide/nickel ABC transporter ATP-binding protein [Amycolatopsis bartoniae]